MGMQLGLRERKKRETRQRISDVATALFMARGFDNVTVAEVAEAADVSKMTVFNYFPRKEELFFDRGEEAEELFSATIRDRRPGESVVAAVHGMALTLLDESHPLSAVGTGFAAFFRVVADSPALQARAREMAEELERAIAGVIAEEVGAGSDDPRPDLVAALIVTTYRTPYLRSARRLLAGGDVEQVRADHAELLNTAFDMLERAVGTYGAR